MFTNLTHRQWILWAMALRASLSYGQTFRTFCQTNSRKFKVSKLSKIELKVRSLKNVLQEFVRFISAMLKKMFEPPFSKVLRFHVFSCIHLRFWFVIHDFDLKPVSDFREFILHKGTSQLIMLSNEIWWVTLRYLNKFKDEFWNKFFYYRKLRSVSRSILV